LKRKKKRQVSSEKDTTRHLGATAEHRRLPEKRDEYKKGWRILAEDKVVPKIREQRSGSHAT